MHGLTLVLAALRLARQQWCGWGHPVSCGLNTIDQQISVRSMEPANGAQHYRESLLLLPGLGTRYTLPERPTTAHRSEFGLPEQALLIVLPSSAFKLHPEGDMELARLLAERPHTRAVLLQTEPFGAMRRLRLRLSQALQRVGADPRRQLIWLDALPRERFLALLACCDVLLDPWHWSGGNTALDALHMGLPILTRWGSFMRGRQSAAMLEQLGLLGVSGQQVLLEHADARHAWRGQAHAGLAQLVEGADALQHLRDVVHNKVSC
jgi:CRISPR-associated protein Csy1